MLTKIIMPASGQTTNESQIVKWHKKIGDAVKKGDLLFEIETDKASLEVESYAQGYLLSIFYEEGRLVSAGETVAYIGEQNEKLPGEADLPQTSEEDEYQPIVKTEKAIAGKAREENDPGQDANTILLASPAARKKAKDADIKIGDIYKTLKHSAVKRHHVDEYLNAAAAGQKEDFYCVALSGMRRMIAKRMTESVSTAPHFTASMDIEASRCTALREKLNGYLAGSGIKISVNDIIMKCAAKAIEKFPFINASYNEENIKVHKNVSFGLAVSVEGGLVVPVVREVNNKTLSQIAKDNMLNIESARNNRLSAESMSGGTITLSSLGTYGVDSFTAIINQPESCILAVGRIAEKPVSENGQIVSKLMLTITASFDHRVIDGAVGAAFLKELKTILEAPELILA